MAKKKKQKKAGVEKRRKSKLEKRVSIKRKIVARQPVQKKISPAKLKQNLKNIPSLIFEPELQQLAFSPSEIDEAIANNEKEPDQIEALATPEFTEKLKLQLELMKQRFEQQGDANKTMMAHAILYFMEQENAPPCLNQIIVALYFDALHKKDQETPLTLKDLNGLLKTYDVDWSDYLKEKADALAPISEDGGDMPYAPDFADDDDAQVVPSAFEKVMEEFTAYLTTVPSLDEDSRDRTVEDVDVLVTDYFEEKEITDLESIRPKKIKSFLEGWFINTMNPTRDDLESMVDSLEIFFRFLINHQMIAEEKGNDILNVFQDKEIILSNLNT